MPRKPLKMCSYPMCPRLTEQQYCYEHKQQTDKEYNANRDKSVTRLYKDKRWRLLRRKVLSSAPLCAECLKHNRLTPAVEVDHIVSHKGSEDLFFDEKNLQGLCKQCHSSKTAKEDDRWKKNKVIYTYLKP